MIRAGGKFLFYRLRKIIYQCCIANCSKTQFLKMTTIISFAYESASWTGFNGACSFLPTQHQLGQLDQNQSFRSYNGSQFLPKWACPWGMGDLCFLTAWRWVSSVSIPREPHGNCITFYHLPSELTIYHPAPQPYVHSHS